MTSGSQTVNEQAWAETFTAGMAALDAGNLKKATKDLQDAVEIAGQLGFTDSLTNSLLALGDAQRLSRHYEKAEETFARAIEFSFKHPTGQRIPYAFSLGALGRLYIEQNKIEQARDQLEMAASILRRHRASAEPEFLTVFLALITCYLEQNDFEKADKLSRYTYDLSKSLVGDSDAATLMVMSMCAASADGLGKQRRADILRCQIRTMVSDRKKMAHPTSWGLLPPCCVNSIGMVLWIRVQSCLPSEAKSACSSARFQPSTMQAQAGLRKSAEPCSRIPGFWSLETDMTYCL